MPPQIIAVLGIVLCAGGVGTLLKFYSEGAQPRILEQGETEHVGTVFVGEQVVRDIEIVNVGGRPLELAVETVSCGCTSATLSANVVLPNHRVSLRLEFRAADTEDPVENSALLSTNDPLHPSIWFSVRADVKSLVTARPRTIRLGDVADPGSESESLVQIEVGEVGSPEILETMKVFRAPPYLDYTLDYGEGAWSLAARLKPGAPYGTFNDNLLLSFDNSRDYRFAIPVMVARYGRFDVVPTSLFFNEVIPDEAVTKSCLISNISFEDNVECDILGLPDNVNVEIETGFIEEQYRIDVTLLWSPAKLRVAKGVIKVSVASPEQDGTVQIEIPQQTQRQIRARNPPHPTPHHPHRHPKTNPNPGHHLPKTQTRPKTKNTHRKKTRLRKKT